MQANGGRKRREHVTRRSKVLFALAAAIVAVIALAAVGLHASIGGFATNVAEESAEPLERVIREAGGTEVCADGYNGRAPWNDRPWYQVFYEIEDSPDLAATVVEAAERGGYELSELPPDERAFASPSQEFRDPPADPTIFLVIVRGDQASSGCDAGTRQRTAAAGNAVIALNVAHTRATDSAERRAARPAELQYVESSCFSR